MMIARALIFWIVGLLTAVPYATYYLFFEATRDQYALLITFVLFWIFGYWGVVSPLISALKVRAVFRAIEMAHVQGRVMEAIQSRETEAMVIDLIAAENKIPKFLAARIYRLMLKKLSAQAGPAGNPVQPDGLERSPD